MNKLKRFAKWVVPYLMYATAAYILKLGFFEFMAVVMLIMVGSQLQNRFENE